MWVAFRQVLRSMFVFSVSGWFPAGATISRPYPCLQLLQQISPGNAHPPSRLCPLHIRPHLPCRYWTLSLMALSSRCVCLLCGFCSSGQRFACGFLRIPPHDGHPCRPANSSPCRACRGLSPPSRCALPGAPSAKKWLQKNLSRSHSSGQP